MKREIEQVFLEAAKPFLAAESDWSRAMFAVSQESAEKTYPCLTTEADELPPTAGRNSHVAASFRFVIESKAGKVGSGSESPHGRRVKAVTQMLDKYGQEYLAKVNHIAAGLFQCKGFVESIPEHSNDERGWRSDIKISAGLEFDS